MSTRQLDTILMVAKWLRRGHTCFHQILQLDNVIDCAECQKLRNMKDRGYI